MRGHEPSGEGRRDPCSHEERAGDKGTAKSDHCHKWHQRNPCRRDGDERGTIVQALDSGEHDRECEQDDGQCAGQRPDRSQVDRNQSLPSSYSKCFTLKTP